MASKANWHSPSATATSVIFFLRIARGGLPIPNKENWHSSFSQRPRRDELFFNIFWTFSGVPVGCSSSGKSALYSIDNLVGSLEDWEDLLSPHFYIQKNGWKTAKISVAFVTTKKVPRAIKNSQRNSLWKILLSHLHYISLIQNVNFFLATFIFCMSSPYVQNCVHESGRPHAAFTAILAAISWRQIKILN